MGDVTMNAETSGDSGLDGGGKVEGVKRKIVPRLYHTKSRKGCQRCRARRVKCDESKPICNNCHRHQVPCVYTTEQSSSTKEIRQLEPKSVLTATPSTKPNPRPDLLLDYRPLLPLPFRPTPLIDHNFMHAQLPDLDLGDTTTVEPAETKSRRLLELRLQQNFISKTSYTFSCCHIPAVAEAWAVEVPKLALEGHDNLLYGILSISALHLLDSEPDNLELQDARQMYLPLALQAQRKEVAGLNSETAEAVCFAASLLLIDAFTRIRDRKIEPYTPPLEWFKMARGAGSVFGIAYDAINNFETSKVDLIVRAAPHLTSGENLFAVSHRDGLLELLNQDISDDGEVWNTETRETYEMTLNYIGGVQAAIKSGEHKMGTCRRMMAFALLAPKRFVEFVEEMRPRALVFLAYLFALGKDMKDIWWFGGMAEREVRAIERVLPAEWKVYLKRPLEMIYG